MKVNAVTSNVADLRDALKMVRYHGAENCYLFVDEIHRFNKAQQDLLLSDVESGEARLIGATTHNPRYYVIDPLLSRSQLFALEPLPTDEIEKALSHALKDEEEDWERVPARRTRKFSNGSPCWPGICAGRIILSETIVEALPEGSTVTEDEVAGFCGNEASATTGTKTNITIPLRRLSRACGKRPGCGFVLAGENVGGRRDPRFIARRLVIFASEGWGWLILERC